MQDLTYRQQKIQEKRKLTPFRDFVMEICSRLPLNFYKNQGLITIYSPNERTGNIAELNNYIANYDNVLEEKDISYLGFLPFYKSHFKSSVSHFNTNENCDYVNQCFGAKNAYLSFIVGLNSENVLYSIQTR
jgi:hypothetical protein